MGPWAAACAARGATAAARMPRAIEADGRIVHGLGRVRNSPAPTAAIAPTTTARSWRFSGAAGVVCGPLTVGPGDGRTGGGRRNGVGAEAAIESCAVTVRATDAPLGPPVDWARNATLTVLVAATVRFVRVAPTGERPLGIRVTDHPKAVRSSGFVIASVTVSCAFPEFVTTRVQFRNRPSKTGAVVSRATVSPRTRAMSTWTSTLPRFVPSASEVATILIVPWSTRAFVGLWIVTWSDALLAALPKLNGSEAGANVNCQSPRWPAKSTVSATFPVFRTTIEYETEPPAAIVRRCDASHVNVADRLTTLVSARVAIVSALTATDNVAR